MTRAQRQRQKRIVVIIIAALILAVVFAAVLARKRYYALIPGTEEICEGVVTELAAGRIDPQKPRSESRSYIGMTDVYGEGHTFFEMKKRVQANSRIRLGDRVIVHVAVQRGTGLKVITMVEILQINGIDVSSHQGDIDWERVRADGIEFAFVRLGYRGYETALFNKDPKFDDNVKAAAAAGVGVGVYFLTQAVTEEEAAEEAQWILEAIKDYEITWPVVIDVEGTSGGSEARAYGNTPEMYTRNIRAFCERIKSAGYTPMIYSSQSWFRTKMNLEELGDYDIWLAYYGENPEYPEEFQIWQYSCEGRVDGIDQVVDLNKTSIDYSKK